MASREIRSMVVTQIRSLAQDQKFGPPVLHSNLNSMTSMTTADITIANPFKNPVRAACENAVGFLEIYIGHLGCRQLSEFAMHNLKPARLVLVRLDLLISPSYYASL